jgi:hypothetical protein
VLIDAGSSGTRVYVFSWEETSFFSSFQQVAQKKMKPGKYARCIQSKSKPCKRARWETTGLSRLVNHRADIEEQLQELCLFAGTWLRGRICSYIVH